MLQSISQLLQGTSLADCGKFSQFSLVVWHLRPMSGLESPQLARGFPTAGNIQVYVKLKFCATYGQIS